MDAVLIEQFGDPSSVTIRQVAEPALPAGWALVRMEAAGINPSDVKNIGGMMPMTKLPRIVGRDVAGVVVKGPNGLLNKRVFASGGDLGFTRDGTHAQFVALPAVALVEIPASLSFAQGASVGTNYLAAWAAIVTAANLQAGQSLVVFGASGQVGNAAIQIAASVGAQVIGVVRKEAEIEAVKTAGAKHGVLLNDQTPAQIKDLTGGGGNVVFDTVGGILFNTALASLASHGKLLEISATGQRQVSFDLLDFYRKGQQIIGVNTLHQTAADNGPTLKRLADLIEKGKLTISDPDQKLPLSQAAQAYAMVENGGKGKVVLLNS